MRMVRYLENLLRTAGRHGRKARGPAWTQVHFDRQILLARTRATAQGRRLLSDSANDPYPKTPPRGGMVLALGKTIGDTMLPGRRARCDFDPLDCRWWR